MAGLLVQAFQKTLCHLVCCLQLHTCRAPRHLQYMPIGLTAVICSGHEQAQMQEAGTKPGGNIVCDGAVIGGQLASKAKVTQLQLAHTCITYNGKRAGC